MKNVQLNIKKLMMEIYKLKAEGLQRIHFIGGEPLLQIDVIRDIVHEFPEIKYSIITNGLYISPDIVDFLVDHNFIVTISHDGASQVLQRGTNILQSDTLQYRCIKRLSQYVPVNISSVLCDDGTTTKDRYNYFNKLDINFSNIDIKPVIPYKKNLIPLLNFTNNWMDYFYTLVKELQELSINNTNLHLDVLTNISHLCFNKNTIHYPYTSRCSIFNKNIITLDQSGTQKYCHNTDLPINKKNSELFLREDRILDKCKNCPIFLLCTGACRLLEDDVWDVACNSTFYHYLAHLIHFVYETFDLMTIDIRGDFRYATNGIFTIASGNVE